MRISADTPGFINLEKSPSENSIWKNFKIVLISLTTTLLPTAVILGAAAISFFVFPFFTYPLIGYGIGWFAVTVAMKIEMYYDLRCFAFIRASVDVIEKNVPFFHLITFTVATFVTGFFGWPALLIMAIPGGLWAASCDTSYFRALQQRDRELLQQEKKERSLYFV